MELKEFTTKAVTEILEGIEAAKSSKSGYEVKLALPPGQGIDFDLAVVTTDAWIDVAVKGQGPDDQKPSRIVFRVTAYKDS